MSEIVQKNSTSKEVGEDINNTDVGNQPSPEKRNNWLSRFPKPGAHWAMFILFLSLLVLCDYCFRYFIPRKDELVINLLGYIDNGICFFFFLDFLWRFFTADNKLKFFFTWGWIDLLASIPYIHILRFLKIFYIFALIRGARSAERIFEFLFASKISTTLLFSFLLFFSSIAVASVCELYFERGAPHSTINTVGGAVWWALMVASTVGNTNLVPVTVPGMIVGGVLTVIGYALFSVNAGLMATWLQNNISVVENKGRV